MGKRRKKRTARRGPAPASRPTVSRKIYWIVPSIVLTVGLCVAVVGLFEHASVPLPGVAPQTDMLPHTHPGMESQLPASQATGSPTAMHGSAEQKQAVRQAFSGIAENIAQVQALEKALVTEMLAEFPDSVEAHQVMAFVLRHHGDSEAATEYYNKALTIDPERGEIYQRLAQIAREKGQLERAAG